MKRRTLVLASAAALSFTGMARAEDATRSYAVMSLIGDKMSIVTYQMTTGTHIDRNLHESIAIEDGTFDKTGLIAASTALKRADLQATVQLFAPKSSDLFNNQSRFFDGNQAKLPEAVSSALKASGATHLVLITKHREEARLRAANQSVGSGMLEGLGFYVDRVKRMTDGDTGERGVGFLAPYAYVKLSLIDLSTGTVLHSETMTESTTIATSRNKESLNPWEALSPTEKVEVLNDIIKREVSRAVPLLIAKP
jgi:hypothetical protein